ncbi:MAG: sulfotransferase [Steroidobacteraceae bacterium]
MIRRLPSSPDLEAYRLMCAGHFADALPFAEQAVAGKRVCVPAHGMLATILLQLGRVNDAEALVSQALKCEQGIADAYDALAHVSMLLGQHERSNALYRRTVEISPDTARFWYNLASSERSFGRLPQAEAACDRAIALDRTQYAAYLLRSELRVQSQEANHLQELRAQLARSDIGDGPRVLLGYALAKELDDLQRYDEAFRWFAEAASTRRRHLDYDVAVDERKMRRIAEVFLRQLSDSRPAHDESDRYIFIVGLPRSGTTLLERILTGLPGVRSQGETDHFARSLMTAASDVQAAQDIFQRTAAADPIKVAANYATLANAGASADRIIEKLPMNYLYLGAIRRALPQAKLLLMRRSPLDSCFAMYRTLFGEAYPFSYDFMDLARYYAAYEGLIAHWRAVLGDELHEIAYEDLVREPLRVGATVARVCGVPWTDAAVDVNKNTSVSLTASAAQIRRPIYASSCGRWRHYRKHLEPLVLALQGYGILLPEL